MTGPAESDVRRDRLRWLPYVLSLAVMLLIGTLARPFGPRSGHAGQRAVDRQRLERLAGGVCDLARDCGAPPTSSEGLAALIHAPASWDTSRRARWSGPYTDGGDQLLDAYGVPYAYDQVGVAEFELRALGADGRVGGDGVNEDLVIRADAS